MLSRTASYCISWCPFRFSLSFSLPCTLKLAFLVLFFPYRHRSSFGRNATLLIRTYYSLFILKTRRYLKYSINNNKKVFQIFFVFNQSYGYISKRYALLSKAKFLLLNEKIRKLVSWELEEARAVRDSVEDPKTQR